jgi:tetratricopeptide (TPR) repeat protein
MTGYSTREISRLLGLSPAQVRSFVRSRVLSPERGPGRRYRFSFGDLVFLKAAKDLLSARVGPRRIRRALAKLRAGGGRLTGLRLAAEGGCLVVGDGQRRWQPESGQILFDFDVAQLARKAAPIVRRAFRQAKQGQQELSAQEWYAWGCELEASAPAQAREAYERALELEPGHADAHVNLGRLLHEEGYPAEAEAQYRRALQARPDDATAAFNLGVALEDLGRAAEALASYERAADLDPANADAHFNAANLCERLGQPACALRHLKAYRQLTRSGPRRPPGTS